MFKCVCVCLRVRMHAMCVWGLLNRYAVYLQLNPPLGQCRLERGPPL